MEFMLNRKILSVIFFIYSINCFAQGTYVPLGSSSMHMIDRLEMLSGHIATPAQFNTTTKAYQRSKIAEYADQYDSLNLSKQDKFNLQYLRVDNFEFSKTTDCVSNKKIGKTGLYQKKSALYAVNIPDFDLIINPVLYMRGEFDSKRNDRLPYFVDRGISIRGKIGKNFSFFTEVAEEIQSLNGWNLEYYNQYDVLPGQNFINTNTYKPNDKYLFSYWNSTGYIAYQAGKYFDVQFGHGKNFIGNGYRSLILSDFSSPYTFLRLNTRIWRINYTNIFGSLYNYEPLNITRTNIIKRHYFATTHASINITQKLNIGIFETTIFNRDSSFGTSGFDVQYLNPVIFYNAMDDVLNSPDKEILGIDIKYNFAKRYSLYGQFALSELNFYNRIFKSGWWGNKEAIQIGLKRIDLFNVSNLDLQLEYNQARPYSYTSYNPQNAFVNYNQSMMHPLGANFMEGIAILRYQPTGKLFLNAKFIYSAYGNDSSGSNWGKNISLSYFTRTQQDFGNYIGQGVKTNLLITTFTASYMLKHNLFTDLQISYRKVTSDLAVFESEMFNIGVALRWNINMNECGY